MPLFGESNVAKYALMIGLVVMASIFSNSFKKFMGRDDDDEHELIRKYLLNDSPLYGYNRPKLWIHTSYDYNSRVWKSFGSRSSCDLNQPYIHLTVRTIINHCGKDFNICLIDDDSFGRLLPAWTVDVRNVPEPQRRTYRLWAMLELLHTYGGMVVPNSFVCVENLYSLYKEAMTRDRPFFLEKRNSTSSNSRSNFIPDTSFMGSPKRDPGLRELRDYVKSICPRVDEDFVGSVAQWCAQRVDNNQMSLLDGAYVGAKTLEGRAITLDDLMQNKELDVYPDMFFGVVAPAEQLLARPRYSWFSVLPAEEVLQSTCVLARLILRGILDEKDQQSSSVQSIEDAVIAI